MRHSTRRDGVCEGLRDVTLPDEIFERLGAVLAREDEVTHQTFANLRAPERRAWKLYDGEARYAARDRSRPREMSTPAKGLGGLQRPSII
jgi:hypothetical protein